MRKAQTSGGVAAGNECYILYAWHVGDSVQITLPTEILSHEMNILKDSVFSGFNP